jgi:hypothetical protein
MIDHRSSQVPGARVLLHDDAGREIRHREAPSGVGGSPLRGAGGDRVGEAGKQRLEAQVVADPAAVEASPGPPAPPPGDEPLPPPAIAPPPSLAVLPC